MSTSILIDGEPAITCQEAAKLVGCTMGYIRRLARNGKLQAIQVGRTYLIERGGALKIAREKSTLRRGFAAN